MVKWMWHNILRLSGCGLWYRLLLIPNLVFDMARLVPGTVVLSTLVSVSPITNTCMIYK